MIVDYNSHSCTIYSFHSLKATPKKKPQIFTNRRRWKYKSSPGLVALRGTLRGLGAFGIAIARGIGGDEKTVEALGHVIEMMWNIGMRFNRQQSTTIDFWRNYTIVFGDWGSTDVGQIVPKGVRRTRRCATNAWEALEKGDEKMA